MWEVSDTSRNITVRFREGMFNETQEVINGSTIVEAEAMAAAMRQIADWCAKNIRDICVCNIKARWDAILKLNREEWWMALAEVPTYLHETRNREALINGVMPYIGDLDDADEMLEAMMRLTKKETAEVYAILHARLMREQEERIWARDLLWWPAWIPKTPKEQSPSLTDVLRQEMKSQGLTLAELSQKTGIQVSNLSYIFNGKTMPGIDKIVTIAEALGMEVRINKR